MDAPELTVEVARWLVTDAGLAVVADATSELDDGAEELRLARHLAGDGWAPDRRAAVLQVAQARRRARARWPDADRLLFTRVALEQASDPAVSAWRARRLADRDRVEDRASGVGGDALAIAAAGPAVTASDTDPARLLLLAHNARVRGLTIETVVADALRRPAPAQVPVHTDPARRVGGRRVKKLADHRPSVPALLAHLASTVAGAGTATVLSPAVDLDDPDLPEAGELEFVERAGHLTEAVLWTGALAGPDAAASATLLDATGGLLVHRARGPRGPRLPVGPVGDWLLEPAAAAVRARLHDELGAEVGARRIAARRALLTGDGTPPVSPWWRARPVLALLPARANAVRRWLRSRGEHPPVELVRHGVDADLRVFHRALGTPPTGPQGWRIELVRTDEGACAVVTDART